MTLDMVLQFALVGIVTWTIGYVMGIANYTKDNE